MNAEVEKAIARLDGYFREYIGVSESSWKTIRQALYDQELGLAQHVQTAVRLATEIARLRSELERRSRDAVHNKE